jgi:hypothetical protein
MFDTFEVALLLLTAGGSFGLGWLYRGQNISPLPRSVREDIRRRGIFAGPRSCPGKAPCNHPCSHLLGVFADEVEHEHYCWRCKVEQEHADTLRPDRETEDDR